MKKIKVLQIGALNSFGGVESFQINLFRFINKKRFQIDFVVGNIKTKFAYEKEIIDNGGKVFYIPTRRQGYLKRHIIFRKILKENNYDVIHIHVGSLYDSMCLFEALKNKVKIVILHSHSSSVVSKLNYCLHQINKIIFNNSKLIRLACSNIAGKWLHWDIFKKNNFEIINNCIDVDKFKFNEIDRTNVRRKLSIEDNEFVIGNVARLAPEKNHKYILEVFFKYHQYNKNSKLLLVGDGKQKEEIINKIIELNLKEYVILAGQRNDIPNLLSAMDCFLLPSFFEGFCITAIEAQANGLKTIVSDFVTKEIILTDLVTRIPIKEEDLDKWVKEILKTDFTKRRNDYSLIIKSKGFDLNYMAKKLEQLYLSK